MSWDQLYDNVKHGVEKAANKLEQTADLASLQIRLAGAEHKMQEAYLVLGRIAYQNAVKPSEKTQEELAKAVRVVALARKTVREMREQVQKQKEERDGLPAPQKETEPTQGQD